MRMKRFDEWITLTFWWRNLTRTRLALRKFDPAERNGPVACQSSHVTSRFTPFPDSAILNTLNS
jgi:hypothetical protein